ncbi:hypothetical protein AB0I54_46310 [Streptomyces sp. NPDC050625]|uniref:hypothetical protein n=1 Tax=Streptomyces sp. NPDC050625 TaxID=3154629 RepID=UPI003415E9FA
MTLNLDNQRILAMDELPGVVGEKFVLEKFRISDAEISTFEDLTGVTEIYGQVSATEYPKGMVEGFHSLSLIDWCLHQMVRTDPQTCYAYNYGLDKVRFPSSLTTSDDLRFEGEIAEVTPRNGGYLVRYRCTITAHGSDKPGLVADWLGLCLPRTSTEFKEKRTPKSVTPGGAS